MPTKSMIKSRREFIESMIKETKGRFFTVHFVKKDGTTRRLTGRTGVYKGTKGGKNTTEHIPQYVTLWCSAKQQHRNINLDTITKLKIQGVELSVTMDDF